MMSKATIPLFRGYLFNFNLKNVLRISIKQYNFAARKTIHRNLMAEQDKKGLEEVVEGSVVKRNKQAI